MLWHWDGPDSACADRIPERTLLKIVPLSLYRQEHQGFRGGGAICIIGHTALWSAWRGLVQSTKDCSQGLGATTAVA